MQMTTPTVAGKSKCGMIAGAFEMQCRAALAGWSCKTEPTGLFGPVCGNVAGEELCGIELSRLLACGNGRNDCW